MVHYLEGLGERGHPRQGGYVHSRHSLSPSGDKGSHPIPHPSCHPRQGLVATLHEGDDFGQLALVNDAPRAATIILREDNCHFLRVDKQDFNRILKVTGAIGDWVPVGACCAPPGYWKGMTLLCVTAWGFGVPPAR